MNVPSLQTQPDASDQGPRVSIAVVPPGSSYAGLVRDAARAAGAAFVRLDMSSPTELNERLLVVDLTEQMSVARLGRRVIAISRRQDLDAYDVVAPANVRTRLKRAVRNLVERETLLSRVDQERETVEILNQIGYALSAQTSQAALLDQVLTHARQVLRADGGSVYLREGQVLRFVCSQNDTIPFRATRHELPMDGGSLAGYVACNNVVLNIADAYAIPDDAGYKPNFSFDRETGYQTRSMLLVPMCDRNNDVIGVLALVNRKGLAGEPLLSFDRIGAFSERQGDLARSIASQAAVAIQNYKLYAEIRRLFDGFVEAAVTSIEARDPSTGGHSHRVAALTTALARACHDSTEKAFADVHFGERELTELHYAAMLHDFGKVGVREKVLLKADKLYTWEMDHIEYRFRLAALQLQLEALKLQLEDQKLDIDSGTLMQDLRLVRKLNRPNHCTTPADIEELRRISRMWVLRDADESVLRPQDIMRLCIPRGSLDPRERKEIEEHVSHTWRFLKVIPWTSDLKNVPEIAYAHHEKLDGSGYPRGLRGTDIPFGARIMAITDIFDALTAGDRPYKSAMPPDKAIQILREDAERGKLESEAVEIFAAKELWRGVI